MNSPFDAHEPTGLLRRAADEVMGLLEQGALADGVSTDSLWADQGGKMFGVLLVRSADGAIGYCKAFSGQMLKAWDVAGWVPPVFNREVRNAVEPQGERAIKTLTARLEAARVDPAWAQARARRDQLRETQHHARERLRREHEERRAARHAERARWNGVAPKAVLDALAWESQQDDTRFQDAKRHWRRAQNAEDALVTAFERRFKALERLRRLVSQEVSRSIYDSYIFENALGHQRSLRALFEPAVPSSGTGDCAAPKLLAFARREGLTPLGIAEFWWGAPPPGGGRRSGAFFPACKDKCERLLPFLLEGLSVAPSLRYRPPDLSAHPLFIHHQDEHVVVIEKPEGLLSVPGTDASVTDSVVVRLQRMFPTARGPLLVHRLDVETSGLLVAALDEKSYVHLQHQFEQRRIHKRYVAQVEGLIDAEHGTIELPVRVDLEQRPRQVVDFVAGKPAVTRFEVIARSSGRTRLYFYPETGRTHQLRVHASHHLGLGAPIVGDRLYGKADKRLMLHAESLAFEHPVTGRRVQIESPAAF
jgi:tRNA pseudouridine32 synthase/23S rRNA pseudouridine746 synthase